MPYWGMTYSEEAKAREEADKKGSAKDMFLANEQAEVRKGYQRWFAWFPVRMEDGKWAFREFVYRHRKLKYDSESSYCWMYYYGDIESRFHVYKDYPLPEDELRAYYETRGWTFDETARINYCEDFYEDS